MYAAKLINTWKSDVGEIEFGGEYNNIAGDGYVHSSGYTDNSEFSNTEQKAAGFVSYSHKILSVNMVAGLRYEYTHERFTEGADRKPFFKSMYDGQEITFDKPFGIFNLYNDLTLPMGFVLSCNFQYMTPPMQYYMEGGERKQLDLVLRKSLFDNTLRFNLSVYDVFDWRIEDGTLKYNNMYWVTDKKYETRYATLSITYLFNNYRKKYRGDNAAKDDMERF
jgi:hypothetical protein